MNRNVQKTHQSSALRARQRLGGLRAGQRPGKQKQKPGQQKPTHAKESNVAYPAAGAPDKGPARPGPGGEPLQSSPQPSVMSAKGERPKSMAPKLSLETMFKTKMLTGKPPRAWNPKMKPFLHTERKDNRHVFHPRKVKRRLYAGMKLLKKKTQKGHSILFVGCNFFFKKWFRRTAKQCRGFYIDQKWLGGLFTNRTTLLHSIKTLRHLEQEQYSGLMAKLPKKELSRALKLKRKLQKTLNGVKYMTTWIRVEKPHPTRRRKKITVWEEVIFLPSVAIFFGGKPESKPLLECQKLGIKTLVFADSDDNPRACRHILPLNYLSFHALKKAMSVLQYGITKGREQYAHKLEKRERDLARMLQRRNFRWKAKPEKKKRASTTTDQRRNFPSKAGSKN